jgi:hypothetical protein
VGLDRRLGQDQPFADLAVGPAAADREQDLTFAL